MAKPAAFQPGDRVHEKHRPAQTGTLVRCTRHTNNSPRWVVKWDAPVKGLKDGRIIETDETLTWEVDLRKAA